MPALFRTGFHIMQITFLSFSLSLGEGRGEVSYSLYASIKISRIFFPAAATLVPGPKMATAPAS